MGSMNSQSDHISRTYLKLSQKCYCWYFVVVVREYYRQVSNIRRTLAGYKIVDYSDVDGASPVGAAPTTSSLST